MALLNCPKCGNLVSDKASNCPKCGEDIKGYTSASSSNKLIKYGLIFYSVVGIIYTITWFCKYAIIAPNIAMIEAVLDIFALGIILFASIKFGSKRSGLLLCVGFVIMGIRNIIQILSMILFS